MSAHPLPSGDRAAAENELLARLGLPPSASPEDVDQLHLAVSQYLAAAPAGLKGWAHAQATALDEAYLTLTDPVGLQGSALRSSTRPPTVVPGGPATPPARRGPVPAAPAVVATEVPADEAETDPDDLEALYASVTPSAHRDMAADAKATPRPPKQGSGATTTVVPVSAPPASPGPWKKIALGLVGIAAVVGILFVANNLGGGGTPAAAGTGAGDTAQASPSGPAVDLAQVQTLMTKLQANPSDTATMQALGDLYYQGSDYQTAGTWYDKVLATDPKNVKALLARGAVSFNLGDLANAQKSWAVVVSIDPKNQEVHYDLGFLYLNQPSPNWTGVQSEWSTVIALDSTTPLAQLVQQHLDSLVAASMIPAPSGGKSTTPSGSPAASGAASPAPSGSPAPSASSSSQP